MSAITFNAAVTNHQLTAFSTWQARRALFTVNLHNRPSFYLNNACLMVRMQYGEEMLLWSGTSADEAERLLGEVMKALKHAARGRIAFKSTLTLISAAVLATGLYAAIRGLDSTPVEIAPEITQAQAFAQDRAFTQPPEIRQMAQTQSSAAPAPVITPTMSPVPRPAAAQGQQAFSAQLAAAAQTFQTPPSAAQPAPLSAPQHEAAVEAQLASNLKKAASRSLFTVQLSSGHERTLYVFADPSCPNCQNFEPLFEALSTQYNVIVFPTSAFGGEKSIPLIKPVLCLQPEQRKAAWQKLFSVGDNMLHIGDNKTKQPASEAPAANCDLAGKALAVNDLAFKTYHFPGTPWVIADDGRHVPQAVMRNPDDMTKFMGLNSGK